MGANASNVLARSKVALIWPLRFAGAGVARSVHELSSHPHESQAAAHCSFMNDGLREHSPAAAHVSQSAVACALLQPGVAAATTSPPPRWVASATTANDFMLAAV